MPGFHRGLIIGGSGMVGANLARRLISHGVDVTVLSRPDANRLRLSEIAGDICLREADLQDVMSLRTAFSASDPDVVFHLASTPFNPPSIPISTHLATNTIGMANLISALDAIPHAKVIFTSSAAVYGSMSRSSETTMPAPTTILGATKAAGSVLLLTHARMTGQRVVELRLFTPYGPWERPTRLIPSIVLSALDGAPVRTSAGLQRRDFLHVDDLLDAMLLAVDLPGEGPEVFNIGSGDGIPVRQLVATVLSLMGDPVAADYGALPTRPDEIMDMAAELSHTHSALGWSPRIGLKEGLRTTVDWVVNNASLVRHLV